MKLSGRTLTATIDIPRTQNWKAMKTISRNVLNSGAMDGSDSSFSTFSLGIVQAIVMVRTVISCLAYPNSRRRRPVERSQAFAAEHHVGICMA